MFGEIAMKGGHGGKKLSAQGRPLGGLEKLQAIAGDGKVPLCEPNRACEVWTQPQANYG